MLKKWLTDHRFLSGSLAALVFYAFFAAFVTFPFVAHPTTTTIAPVGGDIDGSIAKYEALREGHQDPFRATNFHQIAYPDGPPNNVGVDRVSVFSVAYLWLASDLIGAITAHSLLSFLGFVLTAFITYLFVARVTRSMLAGWVAGLIYGFWPHMYVLAGSDMTYTQMWMFLLPIWAFWELGIKEFSLRRTLIAGLSIAPAMFWTPYYTFHILVVGGVCFLVAHILMAGRGWKQALRSGGIIAGGWLAALAVYELVGLHSKSTVIPSRSMSDLYQQSAHPLMYLLPGQYSWFNHGGGLLAKLVPRAAQTNLYLGLSVLALAVVGAYFGLRRDTEGRQNHYRPLVLSAIFVAMACFAFSLPPTYHIHGITIPTPDYLIAHTVPALRAGQRFVMPLMAAISLLAGIGVAAILSKFQGRRQVVVAVVIGLAVALDLWARPAGLTTEIPRYASLAALKQAPAGPVAQFHDGSLLTAPPQLPCLLENQYGKPLINDCGIGRSRDLGEILKLSLCDQISAIRDVGDRYAIVEFGDAKTLSCLTQTGAVTRKVTEDGTYIIFELAAANDATRAIYEPMPPL